MEHQRTQIARHRRSFSQFQHVKPTNLTIEDKQDDCEENQLVPRSGHRIVVDSGNLYALGGYNPDYWDVENSSDDTYYPLFRELWRFNFATRKWKKLKTSGVMPKELASHASIRLGENLLCVGGTGVPFGESSSNDLHVCNLNRFDWQQVECSGEKPEREYGHAMTLHGHYLYVCGGTTGYIYNMNVHRLDLRARVWEKLEPMTTYEPDGRYRHEIVCDSNKLFVFGGGTAWLAYGFNKLPVFDLENFTWEHMVTRPDERNGFPAPRRCHTCVKYKNNVYICGGFDGERIFGDLWKFSLDTFSWTNLPVEMPVPVYFHSADITPEGCMYVFGGVVHIDDVRTNSLYRILLDIPSLGDLCWQTICGTVDMNQVSNEDTSELHRIGMPRHYIEKLT